MSPAMIPVFVDIDDLQAATFTSGTFPLWDGDSFEPSSDYQRKYTRTVVVDQGGKGDFTSVKAACDYVATQTHAQDTAWIVKIMPGTYYELPFTIPSYTTLMGVETATHNQPVYTTTIQFSASTYTGNLITINNASGPVAVSNLFFYLSGTPIADTNLIYVQSGSFYAEKCIFYDFAVSTTYNVRLLKIPDGNINVSIVSRSVYYGWHQSNKDTHSILVESGTGGTLGVVYCAFVPGGQSGQAMKVGGTTFVSYTRIGASDGTGFRVRDIEVVSGVCYLNNTPVKNITGNFQFIDRFFSSPAGIREATAADQTPTTSKGASGQTANLSEDQSSTGAIQHAIGPTGQIKTNQIIAGWGSTGTVTARMPFYDVSGTFQGYAHLYDA